MVEKSSNPAIGSNVNTVKPGDKTSIKTGDDSLIGVFAGLGLLSMATVLVSYRRKED